MIPPPPRPNDGTRETTISALSSYSNGRRADDVRRKLRDARRTLLVCRLVAAVVVIGTLGWTPVSDRWAMVLAIGGAFLLGLSIPTSIWISDARRRADDIEQGWEVPR